MSVFLKANFSKIPSKVGKANSLQSRYEAVANLFSLKTPQGYPDNLRVMTIIRDMLRNMPLLGDDDGRLLTVLKQDIINFPNNPFVVSALTNKTCKDIQCSIRILFLTLVYISGTAGEAEKDMLCSGQCCDQKRSSAA